MENPHLIELEIKYLKEYAEDLLCTRYDMKKVKYYLTCNGLLINENCDFIKSYDTIFINIAK
jgi:hypothetical protein